jgi:predicted O-methyltransferase YrrM
MLGKKLKLWLELNVRDRLRLRKAARKRTKLPKDFEELHTRIYNAVDQYTMTSPERVYSLIEAVKYVEKNGIPGAMVECGVWKGGSTMAMALTLKELGVTERELFLYDTFSGMNEPTDDDVSFKGESATEIFQEKKLSSDSSDWCYSPIDEVRANIASTGYPENKVRFVEGMIEDTIPGTLPEKIALLRLDTDWYESTKHELVHLFPLVSPGGVVIIDDYGYWLGARKAVDEYIEENNLCILLNRIDRTGRIAIKA